MNGIHHIPELSQVEEMRKCAEQGLIAVVNVSKLRSDAVLVTSTKIHALDLFQLKAEELQSLLAKQ